MRTQEKLGRKIKRLRVEKTNFTQEKLAEKINISRTHMGHIEQGRKNPSLTVLNKLARALNISVKDLF